MSSAWTPPPAPSADMLSSSGSTASPLRDQGQEGRQQRGSGLHAPTPQGDGLGAPGLGQERRQQQDKGPGPGQGPGVIPGDTCRADADTLIPGPRQKTELWTPPC